MISDDDVRDYFEREYAKGGETASIARAYDRYEQESFDLADLCRQAGLLGPNDFTTNPMPLIRMFLPID